jgi:hypothetical protein
MAPASRPDVVVLADSALLANPAPNPGAGTIRVVDATSFPAAGFVIVSPEDGAQIELLHYTAINYATNTLTLAAPTVRVHNIGDEVVLVDVLVSSAQANTTFLQTQNFPIVRSSFRLWVNTGAGFSCC